MGSKHCIIINKFFLATVILEYKNQTEKEIKTIFMMISCCKRLLCCRNKETHELQTGTDVWKTVFVTQMWFCYPIRDEHHKRRHITILAQDLENVEYQWERRKTSFLRRNIYCDIHIRNNVVISVHKGRTSRKRILDSFLIHPGLAGLVLDYANIST